MEDEDRNNTHSENAVNNLVTENSGTDTDAVTQTNNQVAQISDDPPPYDEIYNLHWRKGALESNLKIILPGGKSTTHDKVSYVLPNKENSVPGNVIQSDESTEDIFESRFQALEQTVTETRQVAGETHSLQQSICERMASIEQHIRERQPPSRHLSEESISQRVVEQLVNNRTFLSRIQSRDVSEVTESVAEGTPPSPGCEWCNCKRRCTCKCHLTDLNEKWKMEKLNQNADQRYEAPRSRYRAEHSEREIVVSDIESDLDVSKDFKNNLSYISDSDHERPKSDHRNDEDRKMSSLKEKKTEDGVHQIHGASGGDPPSDDPSSDDESDDDHRDKKNKKEKSQDNNNTRKKAKRWIIDADAWTSCLKSEQESQFENQASSLLEEGKLPDKTLLNEICSKYTRQLPRFQNICDCICSYIKQKSNKIVQVWPAYQHKNDDRIYGKEITFVVLITAPDDVNLNEFTICKRCIFDVASKKENVKINKKESNDRPSSKEIEDLEKCLKENAKKLMKSHSKLTRVTASWFKSRGHDTDGFSLRKENCIALYVHVKGFIPLNEEPFPEQVGNYPVDVREGIFTLCRGPHDYHENVKMGCSIRGEVNQGTLGAFVEFENDSRVFGITSAHVVFAGAELKEILEKGQIQYESPNAVTVYQPCSEIFGDAVAALYREGGNGIPGMEIALVEIKQKRWPTDGTFPDDSDHPQFGFGPHKPFEFCSGNVGQLTQSIHSRVVYKYGSESKITEGLYRVNGASVRTQTFTDNILGKELTMHDQLEIKHVGTCPFGEPGDSGGLVVTHKQSDTELLAVGIFEGKMKDEDVYTVTPMYSVLDELKRLTNKRCWLKKFPEYSFSSNVMNDSHTATVSGLSKKVEKLEEHQNEIKDELRKQSDKTDQILQILVALQNKS